MHLSHYKCIVCEKQDFKFLDVNSYFFVPTLECLGCGFRQSEWVSPESVSYYYKNWYRGKMSTEEIEHWRKEYIQRAGYQFEIIKKHVKTSANTLEYGCATGELADLLKEISLNVDVAEYDINYLPILHQKGYKIVSDEDLGRGDVKYDLITCSHVLEHFQNPYVLLDKFKKITREGSIIYFEVPNEYGCVEASKYAKGHLTFFGYDSLKVFLAGQKNFDLVGLFATDECTTSSKVANANIAFLLRRNGSDETINIVSQDIDKMATIYGQQLVFSVHLLKIYQNQLAANGLQIASSGIAFPIQIQDNE